MICFIFESVIRRFRIDTQRRVYLLPAARMTCTRGNGRRAVFHRRNWFSIRTRVQESGALKVISSYPLHRRTRWIWRATRRRRMFFVLRSEEVRKPLARKRRATVKRRITGTGGLFLRFHGVTWNDTTNVQPTSNGFFVFVGFVAAEFGKLAERHPPERDDSGNWREISDFHVRAYYFRLYGWLKRSSRITEASRV